MLYKFTTLCENLDVDDYPHDYPDHMDGHVNHFTRG